MANERTFLAWLRTGIALMTFGFVVDKFDLFLRLEVLHRRTPRSGPFHSLFGLALVASGVAVVVLSQHHFTRVRDAVAAGRDEPAARSPLPRWVTAMVVAVGLALMAYLWLAPS